MSARLNQYSFSGQLITEVCCNCGVAYAVPQEFYNQRRQDKKYFYCPNGHSQHYSESEADRVRREMQKQIDAEQNRVEFWKRESESKKRELKATKTALTKTRKRISNGVCPCCNRSFVNVARHMTTKHPEYKAIETK